jgi:hypothetical protein
VTSLRNPSHYDVYGFLIELAGPTPTYNPGSGHSMFPSSRPITRSITKRQQNASPDHPTSSCRESKGAGESEDPPIEMACSIPILEDCVGICCEVGLFNTAMHSSGKFFLKKSIQLILPSRYRSMPFSNLHYTIEQLHNAYLM